MSTPLTATHDAPASRFVIRHPEGESELTYVLSAQVMIVTHTFVPPALRGRGDAAILADTALRWAAQNRLRIDPQCSYVARFIDRHAEFQPLRVHAK